MNNNRQSVNPTKNKTATTKTAATKITALYERLSREDERENESLSIENQKAYLEEYAARNGFTNIAHFTDDGCTGTNFDRDDWKRLITEVESGYVGCLILKEAYVKYGLNNS